MLHIRTRPPTSHPALGTPQGLLFPLWIRPWVSPCTSQCSEAMENVWDESGSVWFCRPTCLD